MKRATNPTPDPDGGTVRPVILHKGRGATANVEHRFALDSRDAFDDGWATEDEDGTHRLKTIVTPEVAKSILTRNESPDIPFDVSLNPYRGCEHGCVYCYARPSHSFLGLSPGLDFESRLFAKVNAAELLKRELSRPNYVPEVVAVGVNTDAYQPVERELRITRSVIEVFAQFQHPFTLITKSALIERDIDLLAELARRGLVRVALSITTLDHALARKLEPRAASPTRRLRTVQALSEAGIPVSVSVSPMIPFVNDGDLEAILEASAKAGATNAHFIVLRLPWELNEIFQQWLQTHFPDRAKRVMNRVRDMHGGRDYDSRFGRRMRGEGIWSELYRQRFTRATRTLGLNEDRRALDLSQFARPLSASSEQGQLDLFCQS
ncbi:MAG: PA0069 family radical SAM protein [Burkholderiaceae bacterium]|jgi:DNA repair photolyase